jgi:mannose-1-phosphate guanylyltransferase
MQRVNCGRNWGVILAGGDGERLLPLTRLIAGDDRPKQFCALVEGKKTLLEQTKWRIAKAVPPAQTLYVLTHRHERYYSGDLAQIPSSRMIVQKSNRGTLPAILYSLARLIELNAPDSQACDGGPVVGFFPSDHYYARERRFIKKVRKAFQSAELNPNSVILLGAEPKTPETGFGYIEPAPEVESRDNPGLMSVKRFWEKPSLEVAHNLLSLGCVWNTFVMVGRLAAFLGLIQETAPDLYRAFEPMMYGKSTDHGAIQSVYDSIPSADFSKLVLSAVNPRVRVLNLGDVGWSDLGDPQRLMETLSTHGIQSPWRQTWVQEMQIAAVSGQ